MAKISENHSTCKSALVDMIDHEFPDHFLELLSVFHETYCVVYDSQGNDSHDRRRDKAILTASRL